MYTKCHSFLNIPIGSGSKIQPVAQRHHMVSGTLALLKYLVIYMNGKQGSGPDRERSPVEWEEISYVRPSIDPSIPPFSWLDLRAV